MLAAGRVSNGRKYSSDYGQTWSSMPHYNYQGYTVTNPRKCAISASGQYRLFSSDSILHLSSDFGQSWTDISAHTPSSAITNIEISASGQYIAYSYFGEGLYDNGIMWSSDFGQSWTRKVSCTHAVYNMSMTKDGQYLIISMAYWEEYDLRPYLARLYNYGANLQYLYELGLNYSPDSYLATSGDGSLFLKSVPYQYVRKSINQGASWTNPNNGIVTTFPLPAADFATNYKGNVIAMANSRGPDSSYGVWISYDSGASWEKKLTYSGSLITMNQSN
ncbi:hypothetical protein SDC9_20207 [bioreactor metagenome]|uniref:Exo-alpha-sialidase n=1 Tax=bioreactor metagenome TaxID=1076179 RepID=A0A644U5X8_9ZZZZ